MATDVAEFVERVCRPAWMNDALCQRHPEVSWFPELCHSAAQAKAVCARCACRVNCLQYAIDHHESGVWGGTTERQRRQPRQAPAA